MRKFLTVLGFIGVLFLHSVYGQNKELKYVTVVIDPGHGGFDNGAMAYGLKEDEMNLKISLILKEILEQHGAKVYLTRYGDYDMTERDHHYSKQDDMYLRVNKIDSYHANYLLSIHHNASTNTAAWGSQVFYYYNSIKGKELAHYVDTKMKEVSGSHKPMSGCDFRVLRATKTLGLLIECGFITNKNESGQLKGKLYQKRLAKQIVDGLIEYHKNEEKVRKEEVKELLN